MIPHRFLLVALAAASVSLASSCQAPSAPPEASATATALEQSEPVGLSLFFRDGAPDVPALNLPFDAPRYLQEVDLVASVDTATDEGITPVTREGDLAGLDWSGLRFVEEDWRQDVDGTWIRQRFYRGATWMEEPSVFRATPVDETGEEIGAPLVALAGSDDEWKDSDDAFVRRFVARQYVRGCQAKGDCSNVSSFRAQALVQLRIALHPERRARPIPPGATGLALRWTADPERTRVVPITRQARPYGPGFEANLTELTTPDNGSYYEPGETVRFRVTFRDGEGNRLHPEGSLPSYGDFLRGEVESGLRYYDGFRLQPTLYYALKHREAIMTVGLVGPTDAIEVPESVVAFDQLLTPQATTASRAVDGYTGLAVFIPSGPVLFGGAVYPSLWETPVSDEVTFVIPEDAEAGTYVASLKARRDYGGEALHRAVTKDIQVGSATPSTWEPTTGPCNTCHSGPSALENVGHGFDDRRPCVTCHAPISFEPDNALDIRVHWVHDRSDRFPGDMDDCSTCHLEPPSGPARGRLD